MLFAPKKGSKSNVLVKVEANMPLRLAKSIFLKLEMILNLSITSVKLWVIFFGVDATFSICSIFFVIFDLSFVNIRYKYTSSVRFADYMRRFTVYDDYRPEKQNAIVFTGSSTITKWFTLEDDLQPMNVVNRGFGGSEAVDVLRNFRTLFLPLKPRKIVFYEGDNDIAAGLDPLAFVDTCRSIIDSIHNVLPNTQIYILSIKPSPGRKKFWDKMNLANDCLQTFQKKYNFVKYIDIASPLLNENGEMRKELFLSDYVHLNKEGYKVLKEAIRKEMEDELK